VEVVKSHLAPQRALELLLVVCLTKWNQRTTKQVENVGIKPVTSEGELINLAIPLGALYIVPLASEYLVVAYQFQPAPPWGRWCGQYQCYSIERVRKENYIK